MREAAGTLTPLDAPAALGLVPARAAHGASPIVLAWRRLARNPLALFGSLAAAGGLLLDAPWRLGPAARAALLGLLAAGGAFGGPAGPGG